MAMRHILPALLLGVLALPSVSAAGSFERREDVRAFIEEMHQRHGFDRARLLRLFGQAQPQPKALQAILPPKDPSMRSWQTYRARFIEPSRIDGGLRFWEANRNVLEAARRSYGVPEEIVVAIIGIETIYGRNTGKFPTLATLATLAFDYPPRSELFRGELEALLLLARDSRRSPAAYSGSYAGALGIPQFLPSSIRNWGVDFDGDGRIDLAASSADAIGSVANFLASHGWETDGAIAFPTSAVGVRVKELVEAGIVPRLTPAEMADYGLTPAAEAPQQPCALIDLVTPGQATEYWLGYRNFYVITRYNRSSSYAMAVYALSLELKQAWEARLATR
ncbi:MAG: Membrane-bound lytic murein transglycosylase B [Rhodocyclaceae bacterium]|nr:Membrane-bound lytic murein transglycosylase B [Rhodocyclaceae bacterium]CAG0930660.1 membrane-bound lytic murein transglycosylase B [Rhodocyclaceae bacterium]